MTSAEELPRVAQLLLDTFPQCRHFAFHGDLGAGKTTLIKAICQRLGVKEIMSSPTFSIVNEYRTEDGLPVFHFDFYRLRDESEAYGSGLHEYFDSGEYCFVEWPEKANSILPEGTIHVYLEVKKNEERTITAGVGR